MNLVKWNIGLACLLLLLSGCISKKKYQASQLEYQQNYRDVVTQWYQSEVKELNSRRLQELKEATVVLPEYKGIQGLKVVLVSTVEKIEQKYTEELLALDSQREEKLKTLASSGSSSALKMPKVSVPKMPGGGGD